VNDGSWDGLTRWDRLIFGHRIDRDTEGEWGRVSCIEIGVLGMARRILVDFMLIVIDYQVAFIIQWSCWPSEIACVVNVYSEIPNV
jgi:hypothetical protein